MKKHYINSCFITFYFVLLAVKKDKNKDIEVKGYLLQSKIILEIQLIENKEVTLSHKPNR